MERKRLLSEMLKRENTECDSINTIYKEAKDKIYCTIKEKHRDVSIVRLVYIKKR